MLPPLATASAQPSFRLRRRAGRSWFLAALGLAVTSGVSACATEEGNVPTSEPATSERAEALVSYDCNPSVDTGYKNGQPFPITVVTVDGYKAERESANAFLTMAQAAEGAGISLRLSDGFRTMAEQQYYWDCYKNQNCNNGNNAATPGYSNHQSGHAFDIQTGGGAVEWLRAHGGQFGFAETVSGEPWHWEWWGGGNPQPLCATSCDRTEHGFTFSCDGAEANRPCVLVNEPGDPDSWGDNFFCSPHDIGMQWSANGPIAGLDCVNVNESADPQAGAWADNYLCVPDQTEYWFAWSSAGPLPNAACVLWNEPSDAAHSWGDNYLCIQDRSTFSHGRFTFAGSGAVAGRTCLSVNESADPDTWADNFLCTDGDFGLQWATAGAIPGMTCTAITESADQHADIWADNFLCAPKEQSPFTFSWSSAGRPAGKDCVRWYEGADLAGSWGDNWLCYDLVHTFSAGKFTFSERGEPADLSCISVNEPADPHGWGDNYFCADEPIGMKWSASGPIAGMRCTNIQEPGDSQADDWKDNFLCVPEDSPVTFTFSGKDPLADQTCVRWFDHAEPGISWTDNWLCYTVDPTKSFPGDETGGAGGTKPGGGGTGGAGAEGGQNPGQGGQNAGSAGQTSSFGGTTRGEAGSPSRGAGHVDHIEGSPEEAGSCATAPGRSSTPAAAFFLLGGLALSIASRRRPARD
jgi:hypothetical protein